jgi:hypothetical protein
MMTEIGGWSWPWLSSVLDDPEDEFCCFGIGHHAVRSLKLVPVTAPIHSDIDVETAVIAVGTSREAAWLPSGLGQCADQLAALAKSI